MKPWIALSQRVDCAHNGRERRDGLDQAWTKVLETLGASALPIPNTTADLNNYLSLPLAGILLTGGNDLADLPEARDTAPERDATERALIAFALRRRVPLLGVCRGAQILQTYFGGRLEKVAGHVAQSHPLILTPKAPPLPPVVNSYHHYGIPSGALAPALVPWATAADGSVEAFGHSSEYCAGVFWHPERTTPLDPRDWDFLCGWFRLPREGETV